MLKIFKITYKLIRKLINSIISVFDFLITNFILKGNGVKHNNFKTSGIPYIMIARGGVCSIGVDFTMNNGIKGNPIGCYERCTIFVDKGAVLNIGKNVGISQTAIICHINICIEDNVKIGGGVCIYDTDFHSLNPLIRSSIEDVKFKSSLSVKIRKNAFIGAHSLILKGVTVGENSIIGAGSVVTKSIPDNQIWAGNPAKFIKNVNE